ncbi:MAG: radical SAM protein [Spirochaetales bacterium]|nr:radical SAM protein [Spirochaetales bacterium]
MFRNSYESKVTEFFYQNMISCTICPHACRVNRIKGQKGICGAGGSIMIGETGIYQHSEEEILTKGLPVAQFFFSYCPLSCVFCSNYGISIYGHGTPCSPGTLENKLADYISGGIRTIFFVTPEPFLPWIIGPVLNIREKKRACRFIYVTSGYVLLEVVEQIYELFDCFVISIKPVDSEIAYELIGVRDYFDNLKRLLPLFKKGKRESCLPHLLIRILILPGRMELAENLLSALKEIIPVNTPISIMDSFIVCHLWKHYGIGRNITKHEYESIRLFAQNYGFNLIVE